ncbi:MAG: glucose-6-phosphate isomerase [Candidatus Margulisbacteria bacterium]|nr:glucose-6-phosphate isomerase [Candidatus Margulisiibacteriota bacterium]
MTLSFCSLNEASAHAQLKLLADVPLVLRDLLTPERISALTFANGPLRFNYAASLVSPQVLDIFQTLAVEQQAVEKYKELRSGFPVNFSEGRAVQHHATRSKSRGIYGAEQEKIADLSRRVHDGSLCGYSGKAFASVVQVGIGGSDLGPRAVSHALTHSGYKRYLEPQFIANIDPADAAFVLSEVDIETTLFLIVSKTGETQETLSNFGLIRSLFEARGISGDAMSAHFCSITMSDTFLDDASRFGHVFYLDAAIGGRFSVTSAVGGVILALVFGAPIFESFLGGAFLMDEAALVPDIRQNMSLLSALLGVWECTYLGFPVRAVIPYGEPLALWPDYVQQLFCESHGKSEAIDGSKLAYSVGPLVFGMQGSNAQHSFFQKFHQGAGVIPVQFMGGVSEKSDQFGQAGRDAEDALMANLVAQTVALAVGREDAFPGNRPSSLVFYRDLTPSVVGALVAFYENVVMFQGFLWNLNAFDQPGVELGKALVNEVLADGPTPEILEAYLSVLRL